MAPAFDEKTVRPAMRTLWLWAAAAIVLLGCALLSGLPGDSVWVVATLFTIGAALELGAGIGLYRQEGAGLSPMFSGASALLVAAMLFFTWWVVPKSQTVGTLAMLFGVYAFSTALARALDLLIDQPVSPFTQSVCVVASLFIGVLALATWDVAHPAFIARLVGVELTAMGWALAGSAWSLWEHPEEPGYHPPLPH